MIPWGAKDCGYPMALHKTKRLILLTFNINATNIRNIKKIKEIIIKEITNIEQESVKH